MNKNEKLVAEIITRYGEVLDLKERPYVLVEIVRNYYNSFDDIPDGGLPCGGTPLPPPPEPPPPPPAGFGRNLDLLAEVSRLSTVIANLDRKVDQLLEKD